MRTRERWQLGFPQTFYKKIKLISLKTILRSMVRLNKSSTSQLCWIAFVSCDWGLVNFDLRWNSFLDGNLRGLFLIAPARSNQKSAPAYSESLFDICWRFFILNKEKSPNVVVCWHWHFTLSFVFGQSWRGLGKRITWFFKPFLFFC